MSCSSAMSWSVSSHAWREPALDGVGGRARGGWSSTFRSLCCDAALHRDVARRTPGVIAFRRALRAVDHEQQSLLDDPGRGRRGRPAARRRRSRSRSSPPTAPARACRPRCVIPSATMLVRPCISIPSSIITARRRSASGRFISFHSAVAGPLHERSRHRATSTSSGRPPRPASPTGSWTRRYWRVETPDEHPVHHHARQAGRGRRSARRSRTAPRAHRPPSGPAAANLDPPATERYLPILVAVTHGGPIRVVLALRADDLLDLGLQQLAQAPPARLRPTSASNPSLAAPTSCPNASCTRSGSTPSSLIASRPVRCTSRRFLLRSCRIARHAPTRSGQAGGTAVTSKFYEPRDNL